MANNKKVTVDQLSTVANAIATKSDARFRKSADKLAKTDLTTTLKDEIEGKADTSSLGALATKSEVTKADLGNTLKTEIEGKANSTDLGTMASKSEVAKTDLASALQTEISGKANSSDVYAKSETYTKTEVDSAIDAKITSAYKPGGSIAPASVAAALLVADNEGKVYDLTAELTLDATSAALFVDGAAGKKFPAGSNIAVINTAATGETAVYKFDALPGFIDLSGYATTADVEVASAQDIQNIVDGIYGE